MMEKVENAHCLLKAKKPIINPKIKISINL